MRERTIAQEVSMRALDLTSALYRVTELLPRDEPLRRDIRASAGEVFSAAVAYAYGHDTKEVVVDVRIAIEILLGYFAMARSLGRINPMNFLVLDREYREFAKALVVLVPATIIKGGEAAKKFERGAEKESKTVFGKQSVAMKRPQIEERQAGDGVNDRQKVILERLAQSGQVKISDFYKTFTGISSKTIQRDLQDLVTRNFIKKEGDKRWTVYMSL